MYHIICPRRQDDDLAIRDRGHLDILHACSTQASQPLITDGHEVRNSQPCHHVEVVVEVPDESLGGAAVANIIYILSGSRMALRAL